MEGQSLSQLQKENEAELQKARTNQAPDLSKLSEQDRSRVEELAKSIDISDSQQVMQFGVEAQSKLASFSDTILEQVRAKDAGEVGTILSDLMVKVKDLDIGSLGAEQDGFFGKLFSGARHSFNKFVARYEKIDVQIDQIADRLDKNRMILLKDIGTFDMLYERNLEYIKNLDLTIMAGTMKLGEINDTVLPQAKAAAQQSGDPLDAQKVDDLIQLANRFEKKIYDLKLSRTSAIQTVPQIRLIQGGNQVLVDKIQTSILNTIPLWKNQIVIAVGLFRQNKALQVQKEVTDTTNELLKKNSELLKQNTIGIAKESERGIIEIDTLKKVNADLISTLEETLKIQQEGHEKRQQAETELASLEQELKERLIRIRK